MKYFPSFFISMITLFLIGCSSSGGNNEEEIPQNIIGGSEYKSSLTDTYYTDHSSSVSSCKNEASDTYIDAENFLVFAEDDSISTNTLHLIASYADESLKELLSKIGIEMDDFFSTNGFYTHSTYEEIYTFWIREDDENPGFIIFETIEPFIQGFHEMNEHSRNQTMLSYWLNMTPEEQSEAIERAALTRLWITENNPTGRILYGRETPKKLNICVTKSGSAGLGFTYGFHVLDPHIAIGKTTQDLQAYKTLIRHELVHTITKYIISSENYCGMPKWLCEGIAEFLAGGKVSTNVTDSARNRN